MKFCFDNLVLKVSVSNLFYAIELCKLVFELIIELMLELIIELMLELIIELMFEWVFELML